MTVRFTSEKGGARTCLAGSRGVNTNTAPVVAMMTATASAAVRLAARTVLRRVRREGGGRRVIAGVASAARRARSER
jgi:hypothetical protein